ncbi:MAG: hypothetical protein AABX52_01515 [Nanoarchaeota archaeon]
MKNILILPLISLLVLSSTAVFAVPTLLIISPTDGENLPIPPAPALTTVTVVWSIIDAPNGTKVAFSLDNKGQVFRDVQEPIVFFANPGSHVINGVLIGADGNPFTNQEAQVNRNFVLGNLVSSPQVSIPQQPVRTSKQAQPKFVREILPSSYDSSVQEPDLQAIPAYAKPVSKSTTMFGGILFGVVLAAVGVMFMSRRKMPLGPGGVDLVTYNQIVRYIQQYQTYYPINILSKELTKNGYNHETIAAAESAAQRILLSNEK